MTERFDAVIVGGGHNALVAATPPKTPEAPAKAPAH